MTDVKKTEPEPAPEPVPEPALEPVPETVEVRMLVRISGARDGTDWPLKDGTFHVPATEASELVHNRMAVFVAEETAVAPTGDVETATPKGHKAVNVQEKAKE